MTATAVLSYVWLSKADASIFHIMSGWPIAPAHDDMPVIGGLTGGVKKPEIKGFAAAQPAFPSPLSRPDTPFLTSPCPSSGIGGGRFLLPNERMP
ncbi:hypothetical protein [Sphingobium sp. DC-2]|uniref:hypothetical protein n=1 Tax=Sphingobium sp. DC-2 TaxID=1303256 RepID=UPI0012DF7738|nr:hypothetical protein [Sphingobium sp. DC-2]